MGFFKSQEKMVARSYCYISPAHRINTYFGGRIGGGAFYLHIILIFPGRKEMDNAKFRRIICPEKD
jgi:hypothetical protein